MAACLRRILSVVALVFLTGTEGQNCVKQLTTTKAAATTTKAAAATTTKAAAATTTKAASRRLPGTSAKAAATTTKAGAATTTKAGAATTTKAGATTTKAAATTTKAAATTTTLLYCCWYNATWYAACPAGTKPNGVTATANTPCGCTAITTTAAVTTAAVTTAAVTTAAVTTAAVTIAGLPTSLAAPAVQDTATYGFSIKGVDYAKLAANPALKKSMGDGLAKIFAADMGVPQSNVQALFTAGSVKVKVVVTAKEGQKFTEAKAPSLTAIVSTVKALPNINSAKEAGVEISSTAPTAVLFKKGQKAGVVATVKQASPKTKASYSIRGASLSSAVILVFLGI